MFPEGHTVVTYDTKYLVLRCINPWLSTSRPWNKQRAEREPNSLRRARGGLRGARLSAPCSLKLKTFRAGHVGRRRQVPDHVEGGLAHVEDPVDAEDDGDQGRVHVHGG